MTDSHTNQAAPPDLRLWPGLVAAALIVPSVVVPLVVPGFGAFGLMGGAAGAALALLWWLLFSRAPWLERVGAVLAMVAVMLLLSRLVHESISNGFMQRMVYVFGTPLLTLGLIAWAVMNPRRGAVGRFVSMAAAIGLSGSPMTVVRTNGITGDADSDLHWRWTPTAEERMLARAVDRPLLASRPAEDSTPAASLPTSPVHAVETRTATAAVGAGENSPRSTMAASGIHSSGDSLHAEWPATSEAGEGRVEWPGFRGPDRDSVIRGTTIDTQWSSSPPAELWRRPVGPGWSSFAVHRDLIYTQEQRGDDEVVACYRLSTGEPVWHHGDKVRFYESNGGAGPRATPTLSGGRVYTMGATGLLNALDARTGAVIWSRNAATDTKKEIPDWGIAGSPLVIDDVVIVALSGQLAAYDARTGAPRWMGESGGGGYSSPHLATIGGVPQVLLIRGARTISVAPADGSLLWEHRWQPSAAIIQPTMVEGGDILIASADAMGGQGVKRVSVAHGPDGWTVDDRWTSRGLKPYFNDMVVHNGHAYGFDGSILAAIDLADGTRKWKGGRYGHGQLVLLADQNLLLVLSEDGELVLVSATPDKYTEIARVPAIQGKTWNHPVLVGDVLLVRNGEEMAAFRLPAVTSR